MKYENLKIDKQLCFALYATSKAMTKVYKPLLDNLDLTYTQYITLLVLWEKDNITIKNLGEKLFLDSGTLTPLLKRLESMDLLNRVRDTQDERNVYIVLTSKGKNLKEKATSLPDQVLCSTGLTLDEASNLRESLISLLHSIV